MGIEEEQDTLQFKLWLASAKLRGLSELISFCDRESAALDESEVLFGIGAILRGIGEELNTLSKKIDEDSIKPKKQQKRR
jgi:hypothetical protein